MDRLLEIVENCILNKNKLEILTLAVVFMGSICLIIFGIVEFDKIELTMYGIEIDGTKVIRWNELEFIVILILFCVSLILAYIIKKRNKRTKFTPLQQETVDKTIRDEEYVTAYIKDIINNEYPENYDTLLEKVVTKKWFTMDDIQYIAVNVKKMDEEGTIDEFLFAISIEYIGEEIYGLVRDRPRFPTRDWNKIVKKLKREHNVKIGIEFYIADI